MLPEISIRSHSSDQFTLDKVLYANSYRINDFMPNSVVVDVGAHIGSFSINCAIRRAAKIYAFEPLQDNYDVLLRNLSNFSQNFRAFQLGVNNENGFFKIEEPQLISDAFYESSEIGISDTGIDCYFIKLKEAIKSISEKVYLLKLSTKGREYEFLNSCDNLFAVKNLCFETDCSKEESEKITEDIKRKGSFNDSIVRKVTEKSYLFNFSQEDCNICFNKYNTL